MTTDKLAAADTDTSTGSAVSLPPQPLINKTLAHIADKNFFMVPPRDWENMYRNRWSFDKCVRSTHGVNCTGSCSWNIYVKNGLVAWENQVHDYPETSPDMPDFEPRGCPRGASFSWYLYSPHRIRYPYLRGELADLWRERVRRMRYRRGKR